MLTLDDAVARLRDGATFAPLRAGSRTCHAVLDREVSALTKYAYCVSSVEIRAPKRAGVRREADD